MNDNWADGIYFLIQILLQIWASNLIHKFKSWFHFSTSPNPASSHIVRRLTLTKIRSKAENSSFSLQLKLQFFIQFVQIVISISAQIFKFQCIADRHIHQFYYLFSSTQDIAYIMYITKHRDNPIMNRYVDVEVWPTFQWNIYIGF